MNEFRRRTGSRHRRTALDDGYPTKEVLLARNPPTLIENKLLGSYDSVTEYVDVHFDLLLEDCMCPLREALARFNRNPKSRTLDGARVYYGVKLKSLKVKRHEITCMMDIDQLKASNVEPSFGCLIVFTKKDFNKSFFLGTVISDTSKTGVKAVELRLKFFEGSEYKYQYNLDDLCETSFIMIEGQAFFYVYFHVLKALNLLNESNFPMKQYIVHGNSETCVGHPAYLSKSTVYKIFDHDVSVLDNSSRWPSSTDLKMNDSQCIALKKALTEEVALVQGPPGTGKTYFGVSLVKVLLDNVSVWNPWGTTPLLIICQSNEALDHFLEKLLKHTNKLVRIGDQCTNRKLTPFSLKEMVCREISKTYAVTGLKFHLDGLDTSRQLIKELCKGIVNFKTLEKYGIIDKEVSKLFEGEGLYLEWLGMHVKAEHKSSGESNTDLVVSIKELLQHTYQLELTGEYLLAVRLKQDVDLVRKLVNSFKERTRENVKWKPSTLLLLPPRDAQNVYLFWLEKFHSLLVGKVEVFEEGFNSFWGGFLGVQKHIATMKLLKSVLVVGLTSTGAASRNYILQELKAPIVIIEEAGELLESHVVVSMSQHCQHLIMMGDHKQLKPGVTTHHLSRDYNLNISLFERLVRNEVVTGTTLSTQYRMKPEISALLKPHIYPILDDGPGTSGRPPVRGVSKSVFFINHDEMERKTADNKGCWNPHEVGMLINLAKYLVSQMNYAPEDITVIAMYSEQKKKLIEARDQDTALTNLPIASVDSYQGKENEIILLSLVRSNKAGNIGFLKESNRVCVALSRARIGLYIIGNMQCLRTGGKMWCEVSQRLEKQNAIDTKLTLTCDKHKTIRHISRVEDWARGCYLCRVDPVVPKIDNNPLIVPIADHLVVTKAKRCNCCKSFYCKKTKKVLKLGELVSAFETLTLRSSKN